MSSLRALWGLMVGSGRRRLAWACGLTGAMAVSGLQVVILATLGAGGDVVAVVVAVTAVLFVASRMASGLFLREMAALAERVETELDTRLMAWAATAPVGRDAGAQAAGAALFSAELAVRSLLTGVALLLLVGAAAVPVVVAAVVSTVIGVRGLRHLDEAMGSASGAMGRAAGWAGTLQAPLLLAEARSSRRFDWALGRWRDTEGDVDRTLSEGDSRAAVPWLAAQAVLAAGAVWSLAAGVERSVDGRSAWVVAGVAVLVLQVQRQVSSATTTVGWLRGALGALGRLDALDGPDAPDTHEAVDDPGPAGLPGAGVAPTRPAASVARLRGVSVTYPDGTPALRDVDLDLRGGEVVGVCGPNGGGKSTLVDVLLGIRTPTSGALTRCGRGTAAFQSFTRFGLPLHDAVGLGRARPGGAGARLDQAMALAELDDVADLLPDGGNTMLRAPAQVDGAELSAGQWQRVAVARALLGVTVGPPGRAGPSAGDEGGSGPPPTVLALDEATRYMDEDLGGRCLAGLIAWWRSQPAADRSALVFVTHRAEEARLADRLLWVEGGRVDDAPAGAEEREVSWLT